jgi:hypothetical protein
MCSFFSRLHVSILFIAFSILITVCTNAEVSLESIREKSDLFMKNPVKVTSYRETVEFINSGPQKGDTKPTETYVNYTTIQWPYYLSESFRCDLINDVKDVTLENIAEGDYRGATLIINEDLYRYEIQDEGRPSDVSKSYVSFAYLRDPGAQYPYAPADSLKDFQISRLTTGTVMLRKKLGQRGNYLETWRFLNEHNGWLSEYTMDQIKEDGRLTPVSRKIFKFHGASKLPNGVPPELVLEYFNENGKINSRTRHVSLKIEFLAEPLKKNHFKLRIDDDEVKFYDAKTGKTEKLEKKEFDKIYK